MNHTITRTLLGLCLLVLAGVVLAAALPRPFVAGSMEHILTAEPDRAKVIVFWSLDCGYCSEEMQWLSGLEHAQAEVVLVATDPVTEADAVAARLRQYEYEPARHWIFADSYAERLRYDVDPRWGGELPRTYLAAPGAKLIAVTGRIDRERFAAWLRTLGGG